MQYGDEGRPLGISSLLDEIDFRDQRIGSAPHKDMQKVRTISKHSSHF